MHKEKFIQEVDYDQGLNGPPAYHGLPMAPQYQTTQTVESKMNRLRKIAEKYELAGGAVAKLRQLEKYDIVVIADDSSSMQNPAHDINKNDPFANIPSRWEELRERIIQMAEIATCLDPDGIDIYFLNGAPAMNVTSVEYIKTLFAISPQGYTPLSACYKKVLDEKVRGGERPCIIIVATDGEPNKQLPNGSWVSDLTGFRDLLMRRDGLQSTRCPTTIMACTDSEHEIGWLNELDDSVPNIDVVDDYQAEKEEILEKQGRGFHFSMGDYIVKTLIGPIDPVYDTLDEKKLNKLQIAEYLGEDPPPESCPCVIL